MDRPISNYRLKKLVGPTLFCLSLAIVMATLYYVLPHILRPTIALAAVRTARVERGLVVATLTASGTVVPEFEQVLSSPVDARVIKILRRAGVEVKRGEPILELDVSASILAVERLNQALELRRNSQEKIKLGLKDRLSAIESQREIKELELESLRAKLEQSRELHERGLLSKELLAQAELNANRADIELKQLKTSRLNAQEAAQTEIAGLALEIETLVKEREEAARQLSLATTRADRDGVLTWVVTEEGSTVRKGDVIARIADLTSFRVDASISDVHARRLYAGMPVEVRVGEEVLEGSISNILPTVQNGTLTAVIGLAQKTSPLLRSNLRVDVLLITDRREDALKLKKGAFLNGDGAQQVFLLRGDRAVKTLVRVGLIGFEEVEITDGLKEGDSVIISDIRDYMHLSEIRLR